MAVNDLLVRIFGDTKGLERSFAQANRSTQQFGRNVETTAAKTDKATRSLKGFATGAAAGFAGAFVFNEAFNQINQAIDVASNLSEQISKTNVVFGQSADEIKSWAETTAGSIGIANDQALAAASTFGSMFDAAGASSAKAADFSKQIVGLAADLASFNNSSVDDALNALRSGLSGEIEPLRRFQVFLTEASVAQQAMADTGKTSADQLTQGEKILARYKLILEQTGKQQGDFARTSESLANKQRIMRAQVRDLQAALGEGLLPVMAEMVGALTDGATATLNMVDALKQLAKADIPVINIPVNFTFPGTNTTVGGGVKEGLKAALRVQLLGPLGIALNAKDLLEGEDSPQRAVNEAAKAFDKNFVSFTERLEKSADDGAKRIKNTAKRVAAFGEAGFKPLAKSVKQVREERAKVAKELADAAADRRAAAADKLLAGLQLNIDRAALTKDLKDDLSALLAMQAGLQRLIKGGQDVQANQSRLVATIGAVADKRREINQAAVDAFKSARQARQFRAIGLTAEGEEIIPGVANLRKQFEQLSKNMVGQDVPRKLRDRMRLVGKFLKDGAKDATDETILAIRDLFRDVRSTFEKESEKVTGPLTKTTSLNANKVLDGLGLGRDMEKELRARLSSFNSAGKALAGSQTRTTGSFRGTGTVVVENHNTIHLDGDVVAKNTTKSQQRTGRVNPRQKRGPNSGI